MRTFKATLGGKDVVVFAPEPGTFSPDAFRLYFPQGGLYGLDVEATGTAKNSPGVFSPSWRLRTVQFGTDGYAWVLDVDRDPIQREAAVKLLSDPTCTFTSHSDYDPLAVHVALGVDIADRLLDTMWLAKMTSGHDAAGRDLKAQTTRHVGPELETVDKELDEKFMALYRAAHPHRLDADGNVVLKKDGTPWAAPKPKVETVTEYGFTNISADDPTYLTYAGLDAVAVRRVAPILAGATRAPATLLHTERWLSGQAVRITERGHRVDPDRLHALREKTVATAAEQEAKVREITGGLRPAQRSALKEWYVAQGADLSNQPRTSTGGPSLSASKGHLEMLLAQPALSKTAREAITEVVRYAKVENRLTVTQQLLDRVVTVDGLARYHGKVNTIGTVTGRMSSNGGVNMQNFSKKDVEMRGLFLPEPGHVLMSCDFAQIELRVLAALAQEPAMIETIISGGDLHYLTAVLLGLPDPKKAGRQIAKTVNFLIVYGGGGRKLAGQLGFPEDRDPDEWVSYCYDVCRRYTAGYPAIEEYKRWAERQDEIVLESGRRIPPDPERAYANLNYLIQGNARELLAGAWKRFGLQFGRADFMWMPIHDELVIQVPEELAVRVAGEVSECMTFDFLGVPVQADADVLLDEDGVSRWMPGDVAKGIRLRKECSARGGHAPANEKGECSHCESKIMEKVAA